MKPDTDNAPDPREVAREIGELAKDLLNALGKDVPPRPGTYEREYEDSVVHAVWDGPTATPSEHEHRILVFRKKLFEPKGCGAWPPVIWIFNSAAAVLKCDLDMAVEVLAHLRRVAALRCYCCKRERPRDAKGWIQLDTNLIDVSFPEKIACSNECVERWARR